MSWLFLLACAGGGDTADTAAIDLESWLTEPGAHGVGYRALEVSYAEPGLDEGLGDTRTLHLAVWYPSSEDTVGEELYYQDTFLSEGAAEGADEAEAPEGGFPVALFSHGHQGYAENSSFLVHHLASHGWVVLAPDHTNNTFFDGSYRSTDIYLQRPLDISAVLDAALGGDLTLPALDADAVVAMGHSFGGYGLFAAAGGSYDADVLAGCLDGSEDLTFCTTMTQAHAAVFEAGFSEPRVKAWIPMASGDYGLFGADGLGGVDRPVLLMSGDLDGAAPLSDDYQAALPASEHHRHAQLIGGGHQTFTDFSGILETGDGLLTPEEADPLINGLVLAFAERHGRDDERVQPVLDGEVSLSDAVEWR